jgi:hypothetical protein
LLCYLYITKQWKKDLVYYRSSRKVPSVMYRQYSLYFRNRQQHSQYCKIKLMFIKCLNTCSSFHFIFLLSYCFLQSFL